MKPYTHHQNRLLLIHCTPLRSTAPHVGELPFRLELEILTLTYQRSLNSHHILPLLLPLTPQSQSRIGLQLELKLARLFDRTPEQTFQYLDLGLTNLPGFLV